MAKKPNLETLEIHSDSWQRFERAVDVVAKSPPQHRTAKKPTRKKVAKRRASSSSKRESA
jgi:hypothetical protein